MVRKGGRFGYIDKHGNVIIDIKFDDAKSFNNGLALVISKNKEFYIDIRGEKSGNL